MPVSPMIDSTWVGFHTQDKKKRELFYITLSGIDD
jgi:hypothetical protein